MTTRWIVLLLVWTVAAPAACEETLRAALGEADISPDLDSGRPVWLAGYGVGRQATGQHDPLMARCVVLESAGTQLAMVSVDLVGMQLPEVQRIRKQLPEVEHVLVSSTHNHEAPDVIGIWGPSFTQRGVDDEYLELVVQRVVELVRSTAGRLEPVRASYGTAADPKLLGDSRKPVVKDAVLRVIRFQRESDGGTAGLLVQWNCHPEALGSKNTLVTADFPYATVADLRRSEQAPVAYFSGAVGGLMAPPDHVFKRPDGSFYREGEYEYAEVYGRAVAELARKALANTEPVRLTPFHFSTQSVSLPIHNPYYRTAWSTGVLQREGHVWTGDATKPGEKITVLNALRAAAVTTEVGCLRLGELHVACIPGELYPELVYGEFQTPAEPHVDFPDAPLERHVTDLLPGDKWLLLGLCNDEIGYIIPKRQWDHKAPFAYGRQKSQYGEINSCGALTAPILMEALQRAVTGLGE